MKPSSVYSFLFMVFAAGNALGQVTFRTTNGDYYENVIVLTSNDHSLVIEHDGKRINIYFSSLSDEVRRSLGLDPLIVARYDFERDTDKLKMSLRVLDDNYEEHLGWLRTEFRKSGNLEGAKATDDEINHYDSGTSGRTEHPRLERLKEIYRTESTKLRTQNFEKLKVALESYRSTLVREQERLRIENDLESALSARTEEKNVIKMLEDLPNTFQTLVLPGPGDSGAVLDKVPRLGPDPIFGEPAKFKNLWEK